MTRPTEILFVDPGVADLATLLGGLRPEVEAIVLDGARPAARQIAEALEGRRALGAVHVVAHGAPGRVSFAAGDWSAATLADDTVDLTAIGQALAAGGGLRLWSCYVGAGAAGATFVEGLEAAIAAEVATTNGLVGAEALGGAWALTVGQNSVASPPPPPLTYLLIPAE